MASAAEAVAAATAASTAAGSRRRWYRTPVVRGRAC